MEFALWFVHRVPYSPDLIVIIQADPTELVTAFDTFIKNGQWEKIKRCGCLWLRPAPASMRGPRAKADPAKLLSAFDACIGQPAGTRP